MSAVAKGFVERIEKLVPACLAVIDDAENRGYFTDEEIDLLDSAEYSKLPVWYLGYEMASQRDGKRIPPRVYLTATPKKRSGVYLTNKGERPLLFCYGPVGVKFGGFSAEDVQAQLAEVNPRTAVDVHVHSPGGSFVDGVAIHSLFENRPGAVHGFVDGQACSAASVMLLACQSVTMAAGAQLMIHYSSVESQGSWNAGELERALKLVQDTNEKILTMYSHRWKGTRDELDQALKSETYFSPQEAIQRGLADFVSGEYALAAYADIRTCKDKNSFALAARESERKLVKLRRAGLTLWQVALDEMKLETSRRS
jgi:ATP-dependent protease ClpP protease subunit